jgi:hypothetical protein
MRKTFPPLALGFQGNELILSNILDSIVQIHTYIRFNSPDPGNDIIKSNISNISKSLL